MVEGEKDARAGALTFKLAVLVVIAEAGKGM